MKTREKLFTQMYEIMTRQEEIIDHLTENSEEQIRCMRNNDIAQIQKALQKQNTLSTALSALEKQRMQIQHNLENQLNLPEGSTLAEMIINAEPDTQKKLKKLRLALVEKSEILKKINKLNRQMASQALHFSNMLLKAIQPQNSAYTKKGQLKQQLGEKIKLNKQV